MKYKQIISKQIMKYTARTTYILLPQETCKNIVLSKRVLSNLRVSSYACPQPGNHHDIEKFTVFLRSFFLVVQVAEILDVMTIPLGNKIFSFDVCVQDEGMMNQCNIERSLENDEFVITKSRHQRLEKNCTEKNDS